MTVKLKIHGHHEEHEASRGKSLKEMQKANADLVKTLGSDTKKTATLVKAGTVPEGVVDAGGQPTEEQLAAINGFTRTPKTAEELYVFTTLSMNDLPDRDDDYFTTETVKEFAALPQPFSPVGKSYMVDHVYSVHNAMGRIFDVDTATFDITDEGSGLAPPGGDAKKVTFLTNGIYIPNTVKNAGFIEDLDFGINWAVSVGVTLGRTSCTVCESPFSSWGYWCAEGHDKGLYYDPSSEETDSWGYPAPCDPETSGAVKCLRAFHEAKDMYELSQVFLGAQYFAALDKTAGISKAPSTFGGFGWVPLDKAKEIEFPEAPERVQVARGLDTYEVLDDGTEKWVDEGGVAYTFDINDGILCLGIENFGSEGDEDADDQTDTNDNGEEDTNDGTERTEAGSEPGTPDDEGDDPEAAGDEGAGEGGTAAPDGPEAGTGTGAPEVTDAPEDGDVPSDSDDESDDDEDDDTDSGADVTDDADSDEEGDEGEDDDTSDDDDSETATASVAAFATLLPAPLRNDMKTAGTISDPSEVVKALHLHMAGLERRAAHGDAFMVQLEAEATHWFVKANLDPKSGKGVKVDGFKKMLATAVKAGDVDLLKEVIEEQKEIAQARWPAATRRSSVVNQDPNTTTGPDEFKDYDENYGRDDKVDRLHA